MQAVATQQEDCPSFARCIVTVTNALVSWESADYSESRSHLARNCLHDGGNRDALIDIDFQPPAQPMGNRSTKIPDADALILIVGPTGAGRSTFINVAAGTECVAVGKGLRSSTTVIQTISVTHPKNGLRIVFIESPGFDDASVDDTVVLKKIYDWLAKKYKKGESVAGILYLYEISQERMRKSFIKNYAMFTRLCGDDAMKHVILVTTKWARVEPGEGAKREEQLKVEFWKDMLDKGAVTARFIRTHDSAWSIVDQLLARSAPKDKR